MIELENTSRVVVMSYLAGTLDVLIAGGSKNSRDLLVFDERCQDEYGTVIKIKSNIKEALANKIVHYIKPLLGGGPKSRNIIVVSHDESLESLYELAWRNPEKRDYLYFHEIMTIDSEFTVASSLINDNKVIVRDTSVDMSLDNHYILNFDMKVYWQAPNQCEEEFDKSDDPSFFYIPDSSYDGLILNEDGQLDLITNLVNKNTMSREITPSSERVDSFHIMHTVHPNQYGLKPNEVLILT